MRICITRLEKFTYSETFIRNQIIELGKIAEVFTIHSGRLPLCREDGKLLGPYNFWLLYRVLKILTGNRNNYFGEYGVINFLKQNKIEAVIANFGIMGVHMMPVCLKTDIPLFVYFRGFDVTKGKIVRQYKTSYLKLFKKAAAIFCVSDMMKRHLINLGASEDSIQVIPTGIDMELFYPSSKKNHTITFITVGRFSATKSGENTIKAFSLVLKKFTDCKLIMIGEKKGGFEACKNLVGQFNISHAVTFSGSLPPAQEAEHLRQSHIFVQHFITAANGQTEGTPNSILEASASGLPVVSTFHGGVKEAVIHNTTGFLVPEHDVAAMANYMIRLVENKEIRMMMGQEGRKHIDANYNLKIQTLKLYSNIKETITPAVNEV